MRYIYITLLICLFVVGYRPAHAQQTKVVTGTVVDASEKDASRAGISSATIFLDNRPIASTDQNGKFTVNVPANATIEVRYIGFQTVKISVAGKTRVVASMVAEVSALKGVTTVGYVTRSRELATGNSIKITGKDLQAAPAANAIDLLQGKVPGLNIQQNTGAPGMRGSIVLRGISSINITGSGDQAFLQPTSPLFVIDGVPVDDSQSFSYGFQQSGPGISPLSLIPQEDIENVEVLKDAAATSLYGSRGAYGVILIATRRGASKIPVIRYAGKAFLSTVPKLRDVIGGRTERDIRTAQILLSDTNYYNALRRINETPFLSDSLNAYFNNATDWQSFFYKPTYNQTHNLDVSGGDPAFNYKVNVGYFDQKGIQENTGFSRANLNMNMIYMPSSKFRMMAQINSALGKNQKGSGNGLFNTGVAQNAAISSLLPPPSLYSATNQILAAVTTDNDNKTINVNSQLEMRYEFVKGLSATSTLSYAYNTGTEDNFRPGAINNNRASLYTFNDIKNTIYNRNLINYVYSFKNKEGEDTHSLNMVTFTEVSANNYKADAARNDKVINDYLRGPISNGEAYLSSIGGTLNNFAQTRSVALATSLQYDYKRRYVIVGSYRWDRSSTSGPDAGYTKSPAISLRWNVEKEPLLQSFTKNWLDYFAIRGSVGSVIQPKGDVYDVYGRYLSNNFYGGASTVTLNYGVLPNTSLIPEKNTTLDGSIEFGFLKNKITGSFGAYYKQTDDIYRAKALPNTSGFSNIKTNETAMVNLGYEAMLNGRVYEDKDWRATLSANMAINRNYLTALPNGVRQFVYVDGATGQSILYRLGVTGLTNFLYNTKGVYASNADVPVDPMTGLRYRIAGGGVLNYFKEGDPRYTDVNGDYILDNKDLVLAGTAQPTVTGGVNLDLRYKSWTLILQSSFTLDRDILNNSLADRFRAFYNPFSPNSLVPIEQYNFWKQSGDAATYPNPYDYLRTGLVDPYRYAQTLFQEDGSYFKLNYVQLAYGLPQTFSRRLGMNRINVGATCSNVFFITRYSGASPETVTDLGRDSSAGYPNPRTFTFSLNIEF